MSTYCVFNIRERRVGIPMHAVREVIEPTRDGGAVPTAIPLTPPFVRGLFNLRGQVLPLLDLASFIGAQEKPTPSSREDRAVVVERGPFRFATTGRRVDTVDVEPEAIAPLPNPGLYPALDGEARTEYGNFHILHLDRLEASLSQALKLTEATAPSAVEPAGETAPHAPVSGNETADPKSETPK